MCLTVDKKHKINFGKNGYRIFWKQFVVNRCSFGIILRGFYFPNYIYNIGWNYPTTLNVEIEKDKIHNTTHYDGGCLHVSIKKRSDVDLPVICHKKDLIANNNREAAFKKIFIPGVVYKQLPYNTQSLIRQYLVKLTS